MAQVRFTVQQPMAASSTAVFAALIDWRGHAQWVPMTRVDIIEGDGGVGTEFVATTGLGPLALPDRMRVVALDEPAMRVDLVKIGPVLAGAVTLSVAAAADGGSVVHWFEDIRVPWLPQFLARPVAAATAQGFRSSLRRLDKKLQHQGRT